jgi:hypothetical protein
MVEETADSRTRRTSNRTLGRNFTERFALSDLQGAVGGDSAAGC